MKIFYAIQATGNGHISRAMELLPHLQQYGDIDIFLSGANSSLALDAPVKYRSKGLSLFYTCTGTLDYYQIAKAFNPIKLHKEIRDLPVEKYDLIINDFEYITAAACAKKKIASVQYGHHASFQSFKTPRPQKKNFAGERILKYYAPANHYVGLHFKKYDDFIFTPVIKKQILEAEPTDKKYVTVYLPSFCEPQLTNLFGKLKDFQFQVFCTGVLMKKVVGNITFFPVDKHLFNESLTHCTGIITGGGFETPAEALHLGKKIMSIPIRGQYEQQCNSTALKDMGAICLPRIDHDFNAQFYNWMKTSSNVEVDYSKSVQESLNYLFFSLHKLTG